MLNSEITAQNIDLFNQNLRYEDPHTIIAFVLELSKSPIVTTSFGANAAAILYATTQINPDIPVIWCDTGYNTKATYDHAKNLTDWLALNLDIFTPNRTTAFLKASFGEPTFDNPKHKTLSEIVKLEPFARAMKKYQPDVWFTTVRKNQTAYRNTLDILSITKDGVLRVSPFYHFSDADMEAYLKEHDLPVEPDYYDPIKAMDNRECGIQLAN